MGAALGAAWGNMDEAHPTCNGAVGGQWVETLGGLGFALHGRPSAVGAPVPFYFKS